MTKRPKSIRTYCIEFMRGYDEIRFKVEFYSVSKRGAKSQFNRAWGPGYPIISITEITPKGKE